MLRGRHKVVFTPYMTSSRMSSSNAHEASLAGPIQHRERWRRKEAMLNELRRTDPEIYEAVRNEVRRQQVQLEMIASENYSVS